MYVLYLHWRVSTIALHNKERIKGSIDESVYASVDLATLLLDNMREAPAYLEKRPVQIALTEQEASGFHH